MGGFIHACAAGRWQSALFLKTLLLQHHLPADSLLTGTTSGGAAPKQNVHMGMSHKPMVSQ